MLALGSVRRPRALALVVAVVVVVSAVAVAVAVAAAVLGLSSVGWGADGVVTEESMLVETEALARAVGVARKTPLRPDWERRLVDRVELRAAAAAIVRGGLSVAEADLDGKLFRRLGLLAADARYVDLVADAIAREPVGFYDPAARRLVIPSFIPLVEQRATLAHEIAHAVQDQRVGLRPFLKVASDGRRGLSFDAELAREALVEGDAAVLALEAVDLEATFPAPGEVDEAVQRARASITLDRRAPPRSPGASRVGAPPSAPPSPSLSSSASASASVLSPSPPPSSPLVRALLAFPQIDGFAFVARARGRATWAAIDAIWAHPPESTAQILHPDKYDRHLSPLAIELPPLPLMGDGLRLARAETLGELVIKIWLASPPPAGGAALASEGAAERAAAGWRGDRVAIYLPAAAAATAPPPMGADGGASQEALAAPAALAALAWLTAWDADADADDFLQTVAPRLAALAQRRAGAGASAAPDLAPPIDTSERPAIWVSRAGDLIFAAERRGPFVALLLGAPESASPSLDAMLDAVSPRRPERARRARGGKREGR